MDITGIGSVADLAKGLVDRFFPPSATQAERAQAQMETERLLGQRETALLDTTKAVIAAEMAQGDQYTKRARPSIVYFGLVAIGLVHVLLPIFAWLVLTIMGKPVVLPAIQLPEQFWLTWGGVCAVWIVGRSAERRGGTGKLINMITGAR